MRITESALEGKLNRFRKDHQRLISAMERSGGIMAVLKVISLRVPPISDCDLVMSNDGSGVYFISKEGPDESLYWIMVDGNKYHDMHE